MKCAFAIFLVAAFAITGCSEEKTSSVSATSSKASEAKLSPSKGRPTFNEPPEALMDRYNQVMGEIDRKLMVPKGPLNKAAENDRYWLIQQEVKKGEITLTAEVDNASGEPFSFGAVLAAANDQQVLNTMTVLAAVGAAVFGKGEDAGALARACTKAADSKTQHAEFKLKGKEVWCGMSDGAILAGVSIPNS